MWLPRKDTLIPKDAGGGEGGWRHFSPRGAGAPRILQAPVLIAIEWPVWSWAPSQVGHSAEPTQWFWSNESMSL
jgi:hypothetical protein